MTCDRVLAAPIVAVQDEAPARLDRPAVQHRAVRRLAGIEPELLEQAAHADPGALVADADADRAIFVMDAHGDHRMLEARVADAGHRQQQLAGQETRTIHAVQNAPAARWAATPAL